MKALKITLIILVIILLALISFGGIFIQRTRFVENILPEFKLGAELSGTRNIGLVVSTATDTIIYDISIPSNCKADIYLPDGQRIQVHTGSYHFETNEKVNT